MPQLLYIILYRFQAVARTLSEITGMPLKVASLLVFVNFILFIFCLVDIIRQHAKGAAILPWLAAVLALPVVGILLYLGIGRKRLADQLPANTQRHGSGRIVALIIGSLLALITLYVAGFIIYVLLGGSIFPGQ